MARPTLTIARVLRWLEAHPSPTAEDICSALGSPAATPMVRSLLFKLKEEYRVVTTSGGLWMLPASLREADAAVAAAREQGIDTDAIIG